jgi:hypothetical protein
MACPYPSYLKQSLDKPFFTKSFLIQKTFFFPLTSLPIYILSSCLLCKLFLKINFYKNFKFIIGAEATN